MTESQVAESGSSVRRLGGLWLALCLGAASRIGFLNAQSFTMDEVTELYIAKGSLNQIVHTADGFPPLYHLLLHGWLELFGAEAAARWLSVLFGLLTIVCAWKLARILVGARGADWAVVLISVLPFHIWYSQEARAYSLYILLATLCAWLFFRAREEGRWTDWALFTVAGAAGMYTHYLFVIVVATLALCLLLDRRCEGVSPSAGWVSIAVLALLCLPELALLQGDLALQAGREYDKATSGPAALGYTFFSFVSGFTLGPSVRELHTMGASQALRSVLPWVPLVALAVGYPAWSFVRSPEGRSAFRSLLILCLAPVIMVGLLSNIGNIGYSVRYVSWAVVPVAVWVGAGVGRSIQGWGGRAALVLLVFILVFSRWNRVAVDRYREEDSRALASFLERQGPASRSVLVTTHYMELPVGYYLGDEWTVEGVPNVSSDGQGLEAAASTVLEAEPAEPDVWLVYSRPFHGDPGGLLLDRLRSVAQDTARFAGIEVYVVDRSRL